jgi:restriction endonuclease S subunit
MQYSIVNLNSTVGNFRIDSEAYLPIYSEIEKGVKGNRNITTLGRECSLFSKGIFDIKAESYIEKDGIPFIRITNLGDVLLKDNEVIHIPKEENERYKNTFLHRNDIILSKTAYAAASLVDIESCNTSQDTIAVSLKKSSLLLPHYVTVFLNTKYGYYQMKRWFTGNIQMHLNLTDSKAILLPVYSNGFQQTIKDCVESAIKNKCQSKKYYNAAEQLLLSELGLSDWKPKHRLFFVKDYSEAQDAERCDAEYFQLKYEEIVKAIKKYEGGFEELRNLTSLIGHPSNPPYETKSSNNKTFVITQKHLAHYFPVDDFWRDEEALYTTDEFMTKNKKFILKENDLILYSVGAYIGKANIYSSKIKATIGSFLTLIRADQKVIDPFYLLVFLNSSVGQLLTRRNSRGLAQQYIYPYDTKKVIVPLVKKNIQKEIAGLVLKGQHTNNTSKSLLETAKRGVEIAIEKSEAKAEKWMKAEEKKIVEGKT